MDADDSGGVEIDLDDLVAVLDLLAHFWSRPVAVEVQHWLDSEEQEVAIQERLVPSAGPAPFWRPLGIAEALELLDEHDRLFLGPGEVPCPPYESYWLQGVPTTARRGLSGSFATDLRRLYNDLGFTRTRDTGELPDHVAVELEALAVALSVEETTGIGLSLIEHLKVWVPRLCRAVAAETTHRFYRELAEQTEQWISVVRQAVPERRGG